MTEISATNQQKTKNVIRRLRESIVDTVPLKALGLDFDYEVDHIFEMFCGQRVYIKNRRQRQRASHINHLCRDVYFPGYSPASGDVIVDFGIGFGHEAAYIAASSVDVNYIGIEIQPSVFECVALTMARLGRGYRAFPLPVGDGGDVYLWPTQRTFDATIMAGGGIPIPTMTWHEIETRLNLKQIDYLKMNIEGAEVATLNQLDLSKINRLAISCHDFLADRGGGEYYRTFDEVAIILKRAGFSIHRKNDAAYDFARWWVYATR